MSWSPIQEEAISAVAEWLKNDTKEKPVFRLFGYAGTGKTTLARHLAEGVKGAVQFAAFTGKAAHVLRTKGCPNANTIHSLIYKPVEHSKERINDLQEQLQILVSELLSEMVGEDEDTKRKYIDESLMVKKIKEQILIESQGLKKPRFSINLDSELRHASLLVVDECSMVDEKIGEDLLTFEVPILVLGDPAQLPPVKGTGFFTNQAPDILLTEIHRQAEDNPIIKLATRIRETGRLDYGEYGNSRVIDIADGKPEMYAEHDQILLGRERKPENRPDPIWRQNVNRRVRTLLGRTSPHPEPGDKLVCLRNNHDLGLLNGAIFHCLEAEVCDDKVAMTVKSEDSGLVSNVVAHEKIFRGEEVDFWDIKDAESFDFGNSMTVHKAQGSQWNSVLLFDQSPIFRGDARKWLYTAVTRAAERITIVRC